MSKLTYIVIGICALGFIGLGIWFGVQKKQPTIYDEFATCLKDSGTKFFGTFWCPHCRNQKALFGKSMKLLPYIECSTANGQGTLQICKDANITGYPTWEFPDGSRLSGEIPLETLAEKTSCLLPEKQ